MMTDFFSSMLRKVRYSLIQIAKYYKCTGNGYITNSKYDKPII